MTGPSRGIYNFIIKNGEVEGKAEPDRMRRLHFRLRNVKRLLVRLLRILDYRCNANQPLFRLHLPRPRFFLFLYSLSLSLSLLPRNHCSNKLPASSSERERREKMDKSWIKGEKMRTGFDSSRVCPTKTGRPAVPFYSGHRRPWTDRVHKSSLIFSTLTCVRERTASPSSWVMSARESSRMLSPQLPRRALLKA